MLKNFCITVIVAVIISVCAEMLLPEGNIKKYAKLVIGLIIVIVILNPIIRLKNIDLKKHEYTFSLENIKCGASDLSEMQKSQVQKLFVESIVDEISKEIIKNNPEIEKNKLKIKIVLDEDKKIDKIEICQIIISYPNIQKLKKVKLAIHQICGIDQKNVILKDTGS